MISINFNRKVISYMYKQYSNTFGLVKYIYDGNIQKRKVLRFFCVPVYFTICFYESASEEEALAT